MKQLAIMFAAVCCFPLSAAITRQAPQQQVATTDSIAIEHHLPDSIRTIYDHAITRWQENNASSVYDSFFDEYINLDTTKTYATEIPDSVFESRLKMIFSAIPLPYNDIVKRYIVAYISPKRGTMSAVLGRSQYFFPIIEQELEAAGLPLELRMLPVVESALSPTARSRAGAVGLWQFMYATGKTYGLEINSFIDQRCDPLLASKAACRFLKDLYRIFGDWSLAIAAYNCGPGNVNKAISRSGGSVHSFWDIYPYLPRETRGYIPSFIAATYAYTFHKQHLIEPAATDLPLSVDTLMIGRVMHLEQISSTINTPIELLRALNPQYKMDIVPAQGKCYSLVLPTAQVAQFIASDSLIFAKDSLYLAQYLKPSNIDRTQKEFSLTSLSYKVRSGDTLASIAKKHGVTVKQIIQWNKIKNPNRLNVGQALEIYQ